MSTLQDKEVSEAPATATAPPPTLDDPSSADGKTLDHSTQMTCDVLCSLSMTAAAAQQGGSCPDDGGEEGENYCDGKLSCGGGMGDGAKLCPKQMLPMFLSKTYHMITLSDPTIACWSESGDNFVIKNVDKFSASILPRYFKHSNFSSFARQLNLYGFRKMRSDPILTSDVDPSTAGHVRFFHEKFQRDKPELLPHIKRATKTDQQSKDEIDTLRQEVSSLRDTLASTTAEYERRLAELSYDFNRRLSATTVEFDNFVALVQRTLTSHGVPFALPGPPGAGKGPDALHSLSQIATLHQDRGATGAAAIGHLQPPSAATGLGSLVGLSAKRPLDGTSPPAAPARPRLG